MEQRIPKIIHYCWFGDNAKPQIVLKCIESWKKNCPDYEIIEWNENNFDIHSSPVVEEAYAAKKWAFVADYVRAEKLMLMGGIYLDTDMELIRSPEALLVDSFFAGFEVKDTVAAGIIGCEKENELMHGFFEYYQGKHFLRSGSEGITTSPIVLTEALKEKGIQLNGKQQCISGCMVYPKEVFYPTGLRWVFGKYSSKTIGVHHYMDSWGKNSTLGERSCISKLRLCLLYHARNLFGTEAMYKLGQRLKRKSKEGSEQIKT